MIRNPIRKVLFSMRAHQVQCLLMGGQACIFYGAAEFSRDTDFAILAEPENLKRLQDALSELQAERIAVPPFESEYLKRGHAVHFRCRHPEAKGIRIDIMSVMRGVAPFPVLWERRTSVDMGADGVFDLLSLPDLVRAKKTQRDKDWPLIRRLIESHFFENQNARTDERVEFWLKEGRTSSLLMQLAREHEEIARRLKSERPLLASVLEEDERGVIEGLEREEKEEREADRLYWVPLRQELEQLRQGSDRVSG